MAELSTASSMPAGNLMLYLASRHCFDAVSWVTGRVSNFKILASQSPNVLLVLWRTRAPTWSNLRQIKIGTTKTRVMSHRSTVVCTVAIAALQRLESITKCFVIVYLFIERS